MTINGTLCRRQALGHLGALALALQTQIAQIAHAANTKPEQTLPGDSVYQLQVPLTDQQGKAFELGFAQGLPLFVSMFYSSCDMVCPALFATINMTLQALPTAQRKKLRVLMVSFDPQRDTVAVLQQAFQAHSLDEHWTLARTDDANARKLAAVLGLQYRRLASGEFNHSSTVLLLDAQGRIKARSGQLGHTDPAMVAAARKLAS